MIALALWLALVSPRDAPPPDVADVPVVPVVDAVAVPVDVADVAVDADAAPAPAPAPARAVAEPEVPLAPDVAACLARARVDVSDGLACLDALDGYRDDVRAAREVLVRLAPHARTSSQSSSSSSSSSTEAMQRFATDGRLEGALHGAGLGAFAGFATTATAVSARRVSDADALPWLLAAPAVGLVVGGAAGLFAVDAADVPADDVAFIASTAWAGVATGFTLQLAIFADSRDVQAAPLRFATTLAGGALGLAAGAGWASSLDVSAGDAALANSAFAWGGTLGGVALLTALSTNSQLFSSATPPLLLWSGSALLPWLITMALHPFVDLHRVSTWAIDAGGVVGLIAGATLGFFFAIGGGGGGGVGTVVFLGTGLGLGIGTGVAFAVDESARRLLPAPPAPLATRVAPQFLWSKGGVAPGIVVEVARW